MAQQKEELGPGPAADGGGHREAHLFRQRLASCVGGVLQRQGLECSWSEADYLISRELRPKNLF